MKDLKHIKSFNEATENLNISDVSHSLYGEIKVGDTIEWSGNYFSGYDKRGGFKSDKKLSGVNTVTRVFKEGNLIVMELDNKKQFFIKNLREPEKIIDDSWKKL
jgi:hypothetical protein